MSADIATYRINYDVEQWRVQTDNGMVNVLPFGAALAISHLCNEYERLTAELAACRADSERINFIEKNPDLRLSCHKKRWEMRGMKSDEYFVFKKVRSAIDDAMANK